MCIVKSTTDTVGDLNAYHLAHSKVVWTWYLHQMRVSHDAVYAASVILAAA